ncbi:MAG: hypothetical protein SFU86_23450 [Pirellulaceae bacterium]|nr:hypothetical protein [Pirellulaceae bacterium]
MPARSLAELDGKFWKTLKKQAGIKSSGWFKKADASVGKQIETLNKAREKFELSDLTEDLLSYQKALDKLAETFDKFVNKKGLDEVEEGDLKKKEKEELAADIKSWSEEIAAAKVDLDQKIKKLLLAVGGDLKKLDKLEKAKKKEVWKQVGFNDTFNI